MRGIVGSAKPLDKVMINLSKKKTVATIDAANITERPQYPCHRRFRRTAGMVQKESAALNKQASMDLYGTGVINEANTPKAIKTNVAL